jgi:hypothetical protein
MTVPASPAVRAAADGGASPSAQYDPVKQRSVKPQSLQLAPGTTASGRSAPRPQASASGALLAAASLLLTGLAVAMGVVSWHAQYAFIFSVKHQQVASALEALGLDCGAVVFSLLGIALARLGRRAVIERALVCLCAAWSCAMNAAGADLSSPRSVGAFVMPPVLFAITSDRLVSVIRRIALGPAADAESQRSAWRTGGLTVLYAARLAAAPASTVRGARLALLQATPVPGPAAPASPAATEGRGLPAQERPRQSAPGRSREEMSKAAQLIRLAGERHDLATIPVEKVSRLATELAGEIGYHPGTARRVLLAHVRHLQAQNATAATRTVRDEG